MAKKGFLLEFGKKGAAVAENIAAMTGCSVEEAESIIHRLALWVLREQAVGRQIVSRGARDRKLQNLIKNQEEATRYFKEVGMWNSVETHQHPLSPHKTVVGRKLLPGDTIQSDDVYDSTSGEWKKAPCAGLLLQEGCNTIWVRPENLVRTIAD